MVYMMRMKEKLVMKMGFVFFGKSERGRLSCFSIPAIPHVLRIGDGARGTFVCLHYSSFSCFANDSSEIFIGGVHFIIYIGVGAVLLLCCT